MCRRCKKHNYAQFESNLLAFIHNSKLINVTKTTIIFILQVILFNITLFLILNVTLKYVLIRKCYKYYTDFLCLRFNFKSVKYLLRILKSKNNLTSWYQCELLKLQTLNWTSCAYFSLSVKNKPYFNKI